MGVKEAIRKIGGKIGDKVAKLATLSPGQLQDVQEKRENYLLEMPDPYDRQAQEYTDKVMAASSIEIFNAYLPQIKDLYLPIEKDAEYNEAFNADNNIRFFNITKWVTDKKENNLEKLVNVYAVLSNEECNIALVFNRTQKGTNVYLAVVNTQNANNNRDVGIFKARILDAIRGNFPGAEWDDEGVGTVPCLKDDRPFSVASASNIPTEKSEKFISQTIEKLLDGVVPDSKKQEYTIVLLATPILDVEQRKLKLSEFYSGMVPYSQWQTQYTYSENNSIGSSATVGVNVGASAGIQNTQNNSITDTDSSTDNESRTDTASKNETETEGKSKAEGESNARTEGSSESKTVTDGTNDSFGKTHTDTEGSSDQVGVGVIVADYNHTWQRSVEEAVNTVRGTSHSVAKMSATNVADTVTKQLTNTVSKSIAKATGTAVANTLGKAVTKAKAITSGVAKGTNFGVNFGANFARSSTVTAIIGKNEGITQNFANFNIKHALELLESQMKRLDQSTALGMWDFAAYVLSEDQDIANNVAHSYLALTIGEDSYMSKSAINLWRGKVEEERDQAKEIAGYLKDLRHPVFGLNPDVIEEDEEYYEYPSIVTATTSLSGKELAYSLNFPQHSVSGLPVLECAEFGRNVVTFDPSNDDEAKITLGKIFHMNHEEKTKVDLSTRSLVSHAFVTGSTGSGKSNTIYHMLAKAKKQGISFLVVEPAKGEYKNVFGKDKDVFVYGTNPKLSPLLRINPFSFPEKIHILEHLDRLVELFNVCWPMYAAMPAVLKSAVEKSYIDCGWDLMTSENKYDKDLYPDFADVARNIKIIIDSSEYDNENKGAYKGSLLTRLQSLTTGINGLIFSGDELSGDDLFENNVIVDLSRVGSSETKSLIMGMLVLKLQEFRMASDIPMNADMHHITVLEEAHNLLRRTSVEQSTEGSNILGKSVEMLANAIAEMRTYGEGFIIADQAPGLMDMSVIRNTNTKIIMRLPDQGDRELVGKAANLNEDQIKELAKLPCGVGAVYQNEWIQPVLCKVEKHEGDFTPYSFETSKNDVLLKKDSKLSDSLLKCIMDKELFQRGDKEDLRELKSLVIRSRLNSHIKVDFLEYIAAEKEKGIEALSCLMHDFLNAGEAIESAKEYGDIHEWVDAVIEKLEPSVKGYSKKQIDLTIMLVLLEQMERDISYKNILNTYLETYRNGGGVF